MAIIKLVSAAVPNPEAAGSGGDWDLAMAQLTACKILLMGQRTVLTAMAGTAAPLIPMGSYLQHQGAIYFVTVGDYTIAAGDLSAAGDYYIKITTNADTLDVAYENSLVGFTWSDDYQGLYNGTAQILPYKITYDGASAYVKYKILNFFSESGNWALVDGAGNVIGSNVKQDVRVTASPTFNTPTFAGLNLFGKEIRYFPTNIALSSFASPSAELTGLTFDGTNLISCDSGTGLIYIHDGVSETYSSSFASPATAPMALTFDGTNLISSDYVTDLIYIHDGVSETYSSSFASPGLALRALTFDGTNLISCDSGTGLIYIHDGVSETYSSSFASPSGDIRGLAFDGTNLISCDTVINLIYIHDTVTVTLLSRFASPNTGIRALAFDGTNLISSDYITDRIYIHANTLYI